DIPELHTDSDVGQIILRKILKSRDLAENVHRLESERREIIASQAAHLAGDLFCHLLSQGRGQRSMRRLLSDRFGLRHEQQPAPQPFLQVFDEFRILFGDLIELALRVLVLSPVLPAHLVNDVPGGGFEPGEAIERVENPLTALIAPSGDFVVQRDEIEAESLGRESKRRPAAQESDESIFQAMAAQTVRRLVMVLTRGSHPIHLRLERRDELSEGTLAQLSLVEEVDK